MSNNSTTNSTSSSSSSSTDPFAGFELWYYDPSITAAAIDVTIFTLLTLYHAFRLFQRQTWFCIPLVIGGIFELVGYIARALAHNHTNSVALYTIQVLLLLLAPILFAASLYMILGRLIRALHGDKGGYSVIRVTWLTKIFVAGDVLCFLVQAAGGGLLASATTKSQVDTYNDIVLGGLIFQITINCVFVTVAVVFQMRMTKCPTEQALSGVLGGETWKRLMLGLYGASVMITVRNVFRAVEYGLGAANYLSSHEWTLYVFDGLLMIGVLSIGTQWYHSELSVRKQKTEKGKSDPVSSLESAEK